MVKMTAKPTVPMAMTAIGETHARSRITSRDVTATIDEPEARGGTNQGLSPTETLMSSLIGCTNVISHRIAEKMGVEMGEMQIALSAEFHRMGAMLEEEIDLPFSNIAMQIEVATNATPDQLEAIKTDLAKYCPIAKVIRGAGITITENWTSTPL
ncbi:putative redox protein [Roseivivax lentus]|uniref:Putative redox protein n=1 Tax=Roseivivax lentus TaxID=633194 RepID=A0A1N7N286_9RHOB|nr:OsmC family protein [Roseivivax lentus]SIS92523.1 putative redox protein [Roseivivax lentus]